VSDHGTSSSKRQGLQIGPLVTPLLAAACVAIFIWLQRADNVDDWEVLRKVGILRPSEIWGGAYWALLTSALVHFDILHVGFNLYWLWVLGQCMERTIGSLRFLAFCALAAAVSSMMQMSLGAGSWAHGFSGVGYALFGFMWLARSRYPEFGQVVHKRVVELFVAWFFICIIMTELEVMPIANLAHFGGFLTGAAVAGIAVHGKWFRQSIAGMALLAAFTVISLFWAPWSVDWLSSQAYNAHSAERFGEARSYYTRVIDRDPNNAWAYINRSIVNDVLGNPFEARSDRERAVELDSTYAD